MVFLGAFDDTSQPPCATKSSMNYDTIREQFRKLLPARYRITLIVADAVIWQMNCRKFAS